MSIAQVMNYSPIKENIVKLEESDIAGNGCTLDNLLYANVAESYFELVAQELLKTLKDQILGTGLNFTVPNFVQFLNFLRVNVCLSIEECIIAIALLKRFIQKQSLKGVQILKDNNIGTFLIVLFIDTIKIHRDYAFKNSCFARIFSIPIGVINQSELAFLRIIENQLWVQLETFTYLFEDILNVLLIKIEH
ncbi:MAG: hypothetical protein EZS28_018577 [Streblomastix strix]|uniref:Cyclin N-terminal domain-containing protein n=1 Tax=Streblomastix strix TaxID=222440 RepID=A0A5J4VTK2_9EUKA|nr:MAG: hypothetical protein EZS28_018577 [Streblomastix strix]